MSKFRVRIITLLSIFMLVALILGLVFSPVPMRKASADSTYNITGGSDGIFAAKTTDGAKGDVLAYKESSEEGAKAYVLFAIEGGGSVAYERDLALKWFDGSAATAGEAQYFNLTFSVVLSENTIPFDTFRIDFESKEENVTKDGKATNSVVFKQGEDASKLTCYVLDADSQDDDDKVGTVNLDVNKDIKLSLGAGSAAGTFAVYVSDGGEAQKIGEFTNVGENYLEYFSSSSSNPNVPMTFRATAAEGKKAKIFMKDLNGQSLEVTGGTEEQKDDGTAIKDGKITDNAYPVLVLNEEIYSYTLGQKFSHECKVIDVCKKSISSPTHEYYMAVRGEAGYTNPAKTEAGDLEGYKTLTTSTHFLPTDDGERDGDDPDAFTEYVSIRVRLKDDRSESTWAYLHWYANKNAVKTLSGSAADDSFYYIKVEKDREGPKYMLDKNGFEEGNFDGLVDSYQTSVTAAANKEGVSAGSGAYYYLPSLRNLIFSDYADYRNLKFSIYYYKQSQAEGASAGSATGLKYNALRFQIDEAGTYKFRVLATDAAGNAMTFKGEKVTSSNIWELDDFPTFTFEAKYNGVTIEDAKEQTSGNRESTYNISDFKIIALSGIQKDYSLYYFDEANIKEGTTAPTYSDLVKELNGVKTAEEFIAFCEKYDASADKKCISEISVFNDDVKEEDDDWDKTDNAYHWNPDSGLSFVPQKSGFYVVGITVTDPNRSNETHVAYQAIRIGNPYDYTPAPSDWLQNNLVSVILFSISGVLAVAIVILFIVKPSDKKVEEIDLDKLKGKKKNK